MHKNGHFGISLLLCSPFIAFFLAMNMYMSSILFTVIVLILTPFPDVDIYLQRFDSVSISDFKVQFWHWIPILYLTSAIMRLGGSLISKVPKDYELDSVTHRGITHTIWFSLAISIITIVLTTLLISSSLVVDAVYDTQIYYQMTQMVELQLYYVVLISALAGFLGPSYHVVGDIFTPTGIHYLTPRTDYGFTLDQFYAKNEVANRSALPLGIIFVFYGIFFGIRYGSIETPYLVGGFVLLLITIIPIWLIFVRTRIGEWFYMLYDFFS